MSKAAELAALIGSQSAQSHKNMVINGAMNVAQRSTSETAQHTTGYITCDRFQLFFANEDELRLTVTQDTDSPSGFSNSFKIQTTTAESAVAADENVLLMQRIEAQDLQRLGYGTSAAKKATVSFYVKSSVAATYGFNAYHSDGNKVFGQSYTISSANTWERKTITIDANTSDAINDDNGIGLQLSWQLVAGTNFTSGSNSSWETNADAKQAVGHTANAVGTTTNATWQITGVQMELGEQATPFEHRSFEDELARCQRYYYYSGFGFNNPGDSDSGATDYQGLFMSTHIGSNRHMFSSNFPVHLRAIPTLTFYSPHDGASANLESYAGGGNISISAAYSRSLHGVNGYVQTSSSSDGLVGYVEADSEL